MQGVHRGMMVVIGALCDLFRMRRLFFSMVALRKNSCTFVLRCNESWDRGKCCCHG